MHFPLKKLMDLLGVDRELLPYETQPWLYYDEEKTLTCSAEVRMGPGAEDLEVEVQFLPDETDDDESEGESGGGREQIMIMRIVPIDDEWKPTTLTVKEKSYVNEIYNWEEKGCNFFRACIEAMQMSVIPDIDDLIEKELADDDMFGGGGRGKIGRKSPNIKPESILGVKRGM